MGMRRTGRRVGGKGKGEREEEEIGRGVEEMEEKYRRENGEKEEGQGRIRGDRERKHTKKGSRKVTSRKGTEQSRGRR